MNLRKLELKDAPLMFEWMQDENVVHDLHTNFSSKTIKDAENFILSSQEFSDNLNLAVVSDADEYMGTVSLKHIDKKKGNAEFAITMRKVSMGHGYSWYGMKTIIDKAFIDFGLECVFWCVSRKNVRAIRFYEKHNFHEALDISEGILHFYEGIENLRWYSVHKDEDFSRRTSVADCKIIHIKTVPSVGAGELSFFEGQNNLPFDIKRIYYISKVPEGVRRGFHAHKKLKQFLFCPYGKIQLILDNGDKREELELSDPSIGVLIEQPTWREMVWLQKDSVLCVAASDYYEVEDYIRDYTEFKNYIGG